MRWEGGAPWTCQKFRFNHNCECKNETSVRLFLLTCKTKICHLRTFLAVPFLLKKGSKVKNVYDVCNRLCQNESYVANFGKYDLYTDGKAIQQASIWHVFHLCGMLCSWDIQQLLCAHHIKMNDYSCKEKVFYGVIEFATYYSLWKSGLRICYYSHLWVQCAFICGLTCSCKSLITCLRCAEPISAT